jgi:hypothetical protein
MKPYRNSIFSLIIIAFLVTACTGAELKGSDDDFWETYPGQFLAGDVYILQNHEKINGDVAGVGTTLIIEEGATVIGDITLIGSNLEVAGRIAGDVNVIAGSSFIKESALITGSVNQAFHQLNIHPGADVFGEINSYEFPTQSMADGGEGLSKFLKWFRPSSIIIYHLIRELVYILMSLLAISLFKVPTMRGVTSLRKSPAASWGAGLITMIAVPIISLIFVITVCLSPVAVILILAFLLSLLWGWIIVASVIGQQLTKWLRLDWKVETATIFGAAVVGLITSLISIIPCVGLLINSMIAAAGLGSVLLSHYGTVVDQ